MKRTLSACLIFLALASHSQNFLSWKYNDRYFSVSAGTGTASYFGELNVNNKLNDWPSQVNFGVEARLLNRIGGRIEATYFRIAGSDSHAPDSSFHRQRNLSFQSKNFQVQLHGIYYLKNYRGDYHKRWAFDPYFFTGIGYLYFNPTTELGGVTYSLREAKTEGVTYKKWAVVVPLGVGGKFRINEFMNVNVEIAYHYVFTDYLDDVSANYASEFSNTTSELLSDRKNEVGVINQGFYDQIVPGAPRGDPSTKDAFLIISLKAELFLPPGLFSGKTSRWSESLRLIEMVVGVRWLCRMP